MNNNFEELPPLFDEEAEAKRQHSIIQAKLDIINEEERQRKVKERTEEIIKWGKPIPDFEPDEIERICL